MSKKMFSWIKVLVWKEERMMDSFWWEFESGSRSFTSTSIVIIIDWLVSEKMEENTDGFYDCLSFLINLGERAVLYLEY